MHPSHIGVIGCFELYFINKNIMRKSKIEIPATASVFAVTTGRKQKPKRIGTQRRRGAEV